jgi:hypothetical protein
MPNKKKSAPPKPGAALKAAMQDLRLGSGDAECCRFMEDTQKMLTTYDQLIQRASPDEIKRSAVEKLRDAYKGVRDVELALMVCKTPVISKNVTFGKIDAAKHKAAYGFTCVISKAGDTRVIPVPDSENTFADARKMVESMKLELAYKKASQEFLRDEIHRRNESSREQATADRRICLEALKKAEEIECLWNEHEFLNERDEADGICHE